MSRCSVKWCGSNTRTSSMKKDGITFHKFPVDRDRKEQWVRACHRGTEWCPSKNNLMCSRHFDKKYFSIKNRTRLYNDAVPTLCLPKMTNIPPEDDEYERHSDDDGRHSDENERQSDEDDPEISAVDMKPQSEDSEQSENEYENIQDEIVIKQEPIDNYRKAHRMKPHCKQRLKPVRRRFIEKVSHSHVSKLDSRLLETLRLLRRSDMSRKKDECDSFGEYIADSLRKHDDKTQSMIKQAINNILFEQEMKKYNPNQYTVVINECLDENPLHLDHGDKC